MIVALMSSLLEDDVAHPFIISKIRMNKIRCFIFIFLGWFIGQN